MKYCKICKKETNKYVVKMILGHNEPPRRVGIDLRYKTNVEICPECGGLFVLGSNLDYLKMLSTDYEPVSKEEIKEIDLDLIYREIEPPRIHSEEMMVWIEKDLLLSHQYNYFDDLSNGITFDHSNYYKLIRFLLLPQDVRIECFGRVKCPVGEFIYDGEHSGFSLLDGRRRMSLFHYLKAKVFPISILPRDLREMEFHGFDMSRIKHSANNIGGSETGG